MQVYNKKLHKTKGSYILLIPKDWVEVQGESRDVIMYTYEHELRVSVVPCKKTDVGGN